MWPIISHNSVGCLAGLSHPVGGPSRTGLCWDVLPSCWSFHPELVHMTVIAGHNSKRAKEEALEASAPDVTWHPFLHILLVQVNHQPTANSRRGKKAKQTLPLNGASGRITWPTSMSVIVVVIFGKKKKVYLSISWEVRWIYNKESKARW